MKGECYAKTLSIIILLFMNITVLNNLLFAQIIQINPKTNSIHRIYGLKSVLKSVNLKTENISEKNVELVTKTIFNQYSDKIKVNFSDFELKSVKDFGKFKTICYKQYYNGIEVYGSELGYTINDDEEIIVFGGNIFPNIDITVSPKISNNIALDKARERFPYGNSKSNSPMQIFIYPKEEKNSYSYYLTYKIELSSENYDHNKIYFVNSLDGAIIDEISNDKSSSNQESSYYLSGYIKGYIYPRRCYDTPELANFRIGEIKVYNYTTYLQTISSNENGYYNITFSSGGAPWAKIQFHMGNNILNIKTGSAPLNPDLVWYTSPWIISSTNNLSYTHYCDASDATNVFYHANRMYNYFYYLLPYAASLIPGIDAYIGQGGAVGGNFKKTGLGRWIEFGSMGGHEWAKSSDVVFHEYTHNAVYTFYNDDLIGYTTEPMAMWEGIADYFACSMNNYEAYADDMGVENTRHLSNTYTYDPNHYDPYHWNGQVIGGALWDMRQSIGKEYADSYLVTALNYVPKARTFYDLGVMVLIAAYPYDNPGTEDNIKQAFYNHGIDIWSIYLSHKNENNNIIVKNISEENILNKDYRLFQNYPNPFNPSTTISYSLPEDTYVKLSVFNYLGQLINILVKKNQSAGNYSVIWNSSGYPSGIYYYKIETNNFTRMYKMLLIK